MSMRAARSARSFCIVAHFIAFCALVSALQVSPHRRFARPLRQSVFLPFDQRILLASSDRTSSEGESGKSKSINELLSELGVSFRSKAEEASDLAKQASTKKAKILNGLLSIVFYLLFFVYRAYRGFFVLLPAVFKRVYAKLETAMGDYASEDFGEMPGPSENISWKTRVTISLCAGVFTASYAVGGSLQMIKMFVQTFSSTKSLSDSFGAVVESMVGRRDEGQNITTSSSAKDGLLP